jgi:hypothetical protein
MLKHYYHQANPKSLFNHWIKWISSAWYILLSGAVKVWQSWQNKEIALRFEQEIKSCSAWCLNQW